MGDIRVRGIERTSEPQVYLPHRQVPDDALTWFAPKDLVIRASGDVASLAPAVRRIVHETDPDQPVSDVRVLSELVASDTAPRRVAARMLGAFAAIAVLLAGIGLHGLLAFTVGRRAPEIGVRMALGARSVDILTLLLRDILALTAAGVLAGVVAGCGVARILESLLAGVEPNDIPTLTVAVGIAAGAAAAGTLFPAVRALRVDPAGVLRSE